MILGLGLNEKVWCLRLGLGLCEDVPGGAVVTGTFGSRRTNMGMRLEHRKR